MTRALRWRLTSIPEIKINLWAGTTFQKTQTPILSPTYLYKGQTSAIIRKQLLRHAAALYNKRIGLTI